MKNQVTIGVIFLLLIINSSPILGKNIEQCSMANFQGNILYVGGSGPGNYTRIQDAIDNASDGDTVFVYGGLYNESLSIHNTLSLIGENTSTTIVNSRFSDAVIEIYSDTVHVQGFTLSSRDNPIKTVYGIKLFSSGSTIEGCILIYNSYVGIGLFGSSNHNTIIRNSFQNCSEGVYFSNCFSCSNTIKHNDFMSMRPASIIAFRNNWMGNYYDDWIGIGPKLIWGICFFLWVNIDWYPAQTPYNPGGIV